jgi:trk system potassium uptake protein
MTRQSFAVIGLGRFGSALARTLIEMGQDVVGIDANEANVQAIADALQSVVQLDATDERALRAAGIQDVDVAVISIGENIEASLLVVMLVKELGIPRVIAKAVTPLHGRILEKLGVQRVIFPEREMGIRIAHSLVVPNVIDYIEVSHDFSIVDLPAPADFVGQSLKQLALRNRYGLTLIAIKRKTGAGDAEVTNVAPSADDVIEDGDVLSMLGSNERLGQLDSLLKAHRTNS